jgi:hypothetical protein
MAGWTLTRASNETRSIYRPRNHQRNRTAAPDTPHLRTPTTKFVLTLAMQLGDADLAAFKHWLLPKLEL